jgi:hypothetical protein
MIGKQWVYSFNVYFQNTINGLTGPVMMDSDGRRRRFQLDILNLHKFGLTKIGSWNPDNGFDDLQLMNEIKTKHFNVLITMVKQFLFSIIRA